MKRSISGTVVLLLLALLAAQGWAQINQMNRPATTAPSSTAKTTQTAPSSARQPAAASAAKSQTQVGTARLLQAVPIPKKIMALSHNQQLALRSVNTLSARVLAAQPTTKNGSAAATAQMQSGAPRIFEAGVLGVTTKNYSHNHKVGYVLTTQTGGWLANPVYNIKAAPGVVDKSDPLWNCTTAVESVNAQSTSFMNASKNEQGQHLYPGAIYAFDDYASGNFRPFENGLNAMDIYTSTQVGNSSFTVTTPNAVTLHQGISNIIGQFSPNQGGATVLQQTLYSDNESEMAIAISAGGAYDGYSGSDSFSYNQTEHHIYITLDVIKSLFTISAHRPANGFFANGQVPSPNSALVMVQDVTYGARILANIDITITSQTDLNKFQFAYNAIAANGFLNVDALSLDSTITYKVNAYMVGVPASTGIIKTMQDFQNQVNRILTQSTYRNAVPIQYSLMDMDGNSLGVESMTDTFSVRSCTPAAEVFKLQTAFVALRTGSDNKDADSTLIITLSGNNDVPAGKFMNDTEEYKSNSGTTVRLDLANATSGSSHPNAFTLDDFSNGGMLDLFFDYKPGGFHTGDDWDVSSLVLTLTFVSQRGTTKPLDPISFNGFRLSAPVDKKLYFDKVFRPIQ